MLQHRRSPVRGGFTLLEVVLAATIGVMLLAALYVSFDLYLGQVERGRRQVEQSTLVRSLFNRMDADLSACVTLSDPSRYRSQQQAQQSQQTQQNQQTQGS